MIVSALASFFTEHVETFLIYSGIGSVFEIVLRGERQSLVSRLRGFVFYFVGLVTIAMVWFFLQALQIPPILRIDLTGTPNSHNPIVRAAGLTLFPLSALFVTDFFYYWMHRLQHFSPVLWREHSVHHSIRELNNFNHYHHCLDPFLQLIFIFLPTTLLLQVSAPEIIGLSFVYRVINDLIHANSRLPYGPFKYILCEPRYHRIHHSIEKQHWDRNFAGAFPVWDIIFRTAYFPSRDEYPQTGLADQDEPRTIGGYFLAPFRSSGVLRR
jgi:sterol desaturase/sphingolipid hydroxylase (fatty acid hydroxylase superfamily)